MSTRCFPVARLLAALALLAGCGRSPDRPRNIILVTLDTLRADRLGCYGRADAATPNLDALARRGLRFARAMSPSPLTLPSHASMMTGLTPPRHGARSNLYFALAPEAVTLAEVLRGEGFRSGAFVGSVVLAPHYGLDQGFETYSAPQASDGAEVFLPGRRPASRVNQLALEWLDGTGTDPSFLWIHYMDAHAPHIAPEDLRGRFPGDPYQAQIADLDRAFGELMAALEARGRLASSLVVVVADHGEDLGDHGEQTHGVFVYEATLAVPFVMAGPGVRAGVSVTERVGLVDVAPTILDALARPPIPGGDGRSLWKLARRGEALDPARDYYAETLMPRYEFAWSELRTLASGPLKFIEAPTPELYRLDSDPGERHNLYPAQPHAARELRARLRACIESAAARALPGVSAGPSAEERETLRALGYIAQGGPQEAGPDLPDPKGRIAAALTAEQAEDLVREGRPVEAERLLRGLLARDPEALHLRVALLVALLQQGSASIELEARTLLAIAEKQPAGYRIAAIGRALIAQVWMQQGRFDEAAAAFEQALRIPQEPKVYGWLAHCYVQMGRPEDAKRILREGIVLGPLPADAAALYRSLGGR